MLLMDKTIEKGSKLKWALYYEKEMFETITNKQLEYDLDYAWKEFAWHPTFAHKNGKPVIFVYNKSEGCSVVDRWMSASKGKWYVNLKVFGGYRDCAK